MTYVVKRAAVKAPQRKAYVEGDHDLSHVWTATVTVYPDDDDTVYTGIVNAAGDAIHRQVKQLAGFIRPKV